MDTFKQSFFPCAILACNFLPATLAEASDLAFLKPLSHSITVREQLQAEPIDELNYACGVILFYLRFSLVLFDILRILGAKQHVVSVESSSLIHHGTFRDLYVLP